MTSTALPVVSYHDATLVSLVQQGRQIAMLLDDVLLGSGNTGPAAVLLDAVGPITRNSEPVGEITMETIDAEILRLQQEESGVLLVVKWNADVGKGYEIVVYKLAGAQLHHKPPPW